MQPKSLFLIFFIALALVPFSLCVHAITQGVVRELSGHPSQGVAASDPSFPSTGDQFESIEEIATSTSQSLEPLAVFEETPDSILGWSIASDTKPFTVEEVPIAIATKKKESIQKASKKLASRSFGSVGKLIIPSINLDVSIGSVGLTATGNMDVLNDPKRVSWYEGGTIPGNKGSAVIGAHVFQSFAKLQNVKIGSDIYIEQSNGSRLRFVVSEIQVYPYTATAPLPRIFTQSDKARLNLITCDGELTADRATYDHRLVVFAELAT